MVPAVYLASRSSAFAGSDPLGGQGAVTLRGVAGGKDQVSLPLFASYESAYFLYFVSWEFLFRGWMLNGLLGRFGRAGAVLIPTVPFVLMHLGKPELEAFGSILAGIALGVMALRTRSFWYGALVHGVIAVWMDVLASWTSLFPTTTP
jgi:membrane protease YdiL (CAAX protease family)